MRRLPIPDLDLAQLAQLESAVAQAMGARVAAERAEKEAIRVIEEEVLPEWLA